MATLKIAIEEYSNATNFKLYDQTIWGGFDNTDVSYVNLTVTYQGTDYTYKLWDDGDGTDETGMDGTFVNLFGDDVASYIDIAPSDLLSGVGVALDAVRFPDGYYQIKLNVTHAVEGAMTITNSEGFLAEAYCKSAELPFLLDIRDFDHHESRLQRMIISMLDAAVRAGELGRYTDFDVILDKINAFYSARDLTDLW